MDLDVVLIGYNAGDFTEYLDALRAGGADQAAYRDARLAAVRVDGREQTAMDFLNEVRPAGERPMSNADFVWPVLTYLGSYLQQRGFAWDYVNLFREQRELVAELLTTRQVRTVVVTTTVYVAPQPILEIVAEVRRLSPGTRILVGGPYLSDKPQTTPRPELSNLLDLLGADYYVFSSEGERTLSLLLDALCRGTGTPASVPNIAYHDGDGWAFTGTTVETNALEDTPIDLGLFRRSDIGRFVSLRTAKSCPFSCAFCGFPGRAGSYTYLPVHLVQQELDRVAAHGGIDTVTFIDDTFNVPKARFKDILRMMIDRGYGFRWNSYLRSDHVDEEALELMRESGCEGVFLGVESGSARQLENMNKTSRPADYRRVIEKCRDLGIVTYASLIVGFPGETAATVAETAEFLETARPDFYRAQCWYADPYTPVFKDLDRHRIVGRGFVWSHRTMDSREASAWVDRLFATVESSVWLPQQSFELWSVFYLQRHGYTLDGIKRFLRAFNSGVRHRILSPFPDPALPAGLLAAVRSAAVPGAAEPHLEYDVPAVAPAVRRWEAVLAEAPATTAPTWQGFGAGAEAAAWTITGLPLPETEPEELLGAVAGAVTRAGGTERALVLAGDLAAQSVFPLVVSAGERVPAGPGDARGADFAARFLRDRDGRVMLPDTAVLTAPPDGATAVAALDRLGRTALGARLDVVLLCSPGHRPRLAHRRPLTSVEVADLAEELTAERRVSTVPSFEF